MATAQDTDDLALVVDDLHVHYGVFQDHRERLVEMVGRGFKGRRRTLRRVRALQGIDFTLRQGDALGVIGHNGAGKSTLLRTLAGLLPSSAGTVLVREQPHILGVSAALNYYISGRRNIEVCGLALGLSKREVELQIPEILDFAELGDFADLPVHTYSAGMQSRLSFAVSTLTRPKILLIDEALAVGDAQFVEKSLERLRTVRAGAGVIVMATHSMHEVLATCNKALWLHEGRQEAFGEPEAIVEQYLADDRTPARSLAD